jgi:hypothetical protein
VILLVLSLIGLQVPPAPSGLVLPPGAVEILDPIAPAVARYEACLSQKYHEAHPGGVGDPDGHRRAVDLSIVKCSEVRREAVADAERALARAPDYKDPARRDLAIRHAFEGTEHVRRELVAMVSSGQLRGPEPSVAPVPQVRVSRRVMPAAMQYMRCMTAVTNAALRNEVASARQATITASDAECRARGLQALPQAVIGGVANHNPAEVAALNKAMDAMRASMARPLQPDPSLRVNEVIKVVPGKPNAPNP